MAENAVADLFIVALLTITGIATERKKTSYSEPSEWGDTRV
jgi:hypothetical protein